MGLKKLVRYFCQELTENDKIALEDLVRRRIEEGPLTSEDLMVLSTDGKKAFDDICSELRQSGRKYMVYAA